MSHQESFVENIRGVVYHEIAIRWGKLQYFASHIKGNLIKLITSNSPWNPMVFWRFLGGGGGGRIRTLMWIYFVVDFGWIFHNFIVFHNFYNSSLFS